ncbi:MAG: FCD domain-containing protein [Simkaniaceae bacterium]|nr:FCD domain-containing protein [Simkaniaceae bacterium]
MSLEQQIQEDILEGKLQPGAKVNISLLKKEYDVGLAPLREALSRLTRTGLLLSEQNKGYTVAPVSLSELTDIYEISAHIEALAISQAIDRGGSEWEEEIIASLYQLQKLEKAKVKPKFDAWMAANSRFHAALVGSASQLALDLRAQVGLRAERYVRLAYSDVVLNEFSDEHQRLADACLARDKKKAVLLVKEHSLSGREVHLKRFMDVTT